MKISTAILSLVPDANFSVENNDYNKVVWNDERPKPTKAQVLAEVERLKQEYVSKQYQRDRQLVYPSIQEQLDMQYHDAINGTTVWQDTISAIKNQFPK